MGACRRGPYVRTMPSLHIEHAITDLPTWTAAYSAFAAVRKDAGVRHEQVRQPIDDPHFVVIDLDFDSIEEAEGFLAFLRANVWAVPENSPALAGTPDAKILEPVFTG